MQQQAYSTQQFIKDRNRQMTNLHEVAIVAVVFCSLINAFLCNDNKIDSSSIVIEFHSLITKYNQAYHQQCV